MKLIGYLGHKLVFHEGNHMYALLCAALNTVVTNRTMPSREVEPAKTIQALTTHPQKQRKQICSVRSTIIFHQEAKNYLQKTKGI